MMVDLFVAAAWGVLVYAGMMGMHYAFAHGERRRLRERVVDPVARFIKYRVLGCRRRYDKWYHLRDRSAQQTRAVGRRRRLI